MSIDDYISQNNKNSGSRNQSKEQSTEKVLEYTVWESSDGLLRMVDFDPEYFREHVSTEVKDKAKDKGLVFFNPHNDSIVLTDSPDKCESALEAFGLENYLKKRIEGAL